MRHKFTETEKILFIAIRLAEDAIHDRGPFTSAQHACWCLRSICKKLAKTYRLSEDILHAQAWYRVSTSEALQLDETVIIPSRQIPYISRQPRHENPPTRKPADFVPVTRPEREIPQRPEVESLETRIQTILHPNGAAAKYVYARPKARVGT